ncbi:kelch repeat-containing protein [Promineifilum sp.]|uniref:Kelch repeat-containing protein n=1 Tax=Promineifilum sp. TaxID=2664178 RepID=UPI0035AEF3D5
MPERGEPLSDRELEVLHRLAAGESNKAIADGLSISPLTVKTHLRNIYTKLGVSTRTEAMTVALQQGVLGLPGETIITAPAVAVPETPELPLEPPELLLPPNGEVAARAPARVRGPRRPWRVLSLALLALLLLTAAALAFVQWRDGAPFATPTPELFAEQPIGDTRWLNGRPLPEARAGRAVASVGLDVYLIGGETAAGVTGEVRVFDTLEHVWRSAVAKPTPVTATTADELFGELYVPGGLDADGQPTAVVEAYSPSQDAWRRVASLPQPVAGGLAVAEGGFLYLLGGRNDEGPLDTAYIYDPGADSWRPVASLPAARGEPTGGAVTGRIYVVGGSDGATDQASCYVYDPPADAWDDCPPMLQPRAGAGAAVLLNKLYVIGGVRGEEGPGHGEVYDPISRTWTVLNAPPDVGNWSELAVTLVETRIYALGGRRGDALSDANLIYAPLVFQTYIPAVPSDSGGDGNE